MGALQRRIERAWQNSKDWITEFDGSANQAYLANVPVNALPQAFLTLAQQSVNFRVSTISAEVEDQSEFVSPESIQDQISRLQRDEIAGLNVNYAVQLEAFDLDLHIVVNPSGSQKVDLEIVWWSDQVFSDEGDHYAEFRALLNYFISLQNLFKSPKLYIGPETFEKPGAGSLDWVEI